MYVVALTGGIGSGKTVVSKLFAELGINIIDTDIIARELVQPGKPALEQIKLHFGSSILAADHTLDRSALRKLVFENPVEKQWLENLLHPLIRSEALQQIKLTKSHYCVVVIPLLFETFVPDYIDRILLVDTSKELQMQRVMTRDKSEQVFIEKIIQSQASAEQRRAGADDIIENNGSIEDLAKKVKLLHAQYLVSSNNKKINC